MLCLTQTPYQAMLDDVRCWVDAPFLLQYSLPFYHLVFHVDTGALSTGAGANLLLLVAIRRQGCLY